MTRTLLAVVLVTAVGSAAADCPRPAAEAPTRVHVVRAAAGTRIVIDTPITVCGRPPTPQVAYLAPAPRLGYAWADVELDLLPLILRSVVTQAPFAPSTAHPAATTGAVQP